jgi:hypothetical protein
MYSIAIHTISDPEKFWAGAQTLEVPQGMTLHSTIGNKDGTKAVCIWEADSVDSIRDFVDPATEGMSSNEYFEANEQYSMGLPAHAGATN